MRDRRISATGAAPPSAPSAVNGRGSATYSSGPSATVETPVRSTGAASAWLNWGGSVVATTSPPAANAMSLPVMALSWLASASFSRNPTRDRSEDLRLRQADGDRHGHDLHDAVPLRQQSHGFVPEQRVMHGPPVASLHADRGGIARRGEHTSGGVGDDQEVGGLQRLLVVAEVVLDVLYGRRVIRRYRRLELRQVGNQPRHQRVRVDAGFAKLIDERDRGPQLALQRDLCLPRDPLVHDVDRGAYREDREQRARQENPSSQRADEPHRSAKSSSASPPSGTTTACGPDDTPSFHATRL